MFCMVDRWRSLDLSKLFTIMNRMEAEIEAQTLTISASSLPELRKLTSRLKKVQEIHKEKSLTIEQASLTTAIASEDISMDHLPNYGSKHVTGGPYLTNPRVYDLLISERKSASTETQRERVSEYQRFFAYAQLPVDRLSKVFEDVERQRMHKLAKTGVGLRQE